MVTVIHSVINRNNVRHSRESGNPEKHWIPGQARNDKLHKTYVAMYNNTKIQRRLLAVCCKDLLGDHFLLFTFLPGLCPSQVLQISFILFSIRFLLVPDKIIERNI